MQEVHDGRCGLSNHFGETHTRAEKGGVPNQS